MQTKAEKQQIWKESHDNKETEHSGFKEILYKIAEMAFWNIMKKETIQYVQNCLKCQKKEEYWKTRLDGKVRRSERTWKQISIDYITKLSWIKKKDLIFVIQDQLSDMIYLKAVREKEIAKKMWQDCKETIWKLHGYSSEIRIDRRATFIFKIWKEYEKEFRIHPRKTIAYHLQSNDQIKRINREIKKYLRKFVNHHQDNWPELLSMLEFSCNIKKADKQTFAFY